MSHQNLASRQIIAGCNCTPLKINFIFPYPNTFSTIKNLTFKAFANFTLGNR